jgi:hypothetical protein
MVSEDGKPFVVKVCGRERKGGLWEGWLEFVPDDGSPVLRSERETTQPNRVDLQYWASGLSVTYAQGALRRASEPQQPVLRPPEDRSAYSRPAPSPLSTRRSPLDPFAIHARDPLRLREQLGALSPSNLLRVIRAYRLADEHHQDLRARSQDELVELVFRAVESAAQRSD